MSGDVRPVSATQGFLLGLVLGAPWFAPALMPWGVEGLFLLSAFLLRGADRRWQGRPGWRGWTSHIRMAPSRLLPWAAMAVVALIAAPPQSATPIGILIAATLCELLVYPLLGTMLGKARRPILLAGILLTVATMGMGGEILRDIAAFSTGTLLCVFWLRGPDGEPRALLLAILGTGLSGAVAWAIPAGLSWAVPATAVCLTLALAHVSTLRRRPLHWRGHGALATGRLAWRIPAA
jgi:hypothetical protein